MTKSAISYLGALSLLTFVYFVAGKAGLELAFVQANATAVWAPTGIALAALLLFGYRLWPAIFVGAFLVNFTTEGTVATSIGIALGNTLEALAGAYLINRFANGYNFMKKPKDLSKFILTVTAFAAPISAFVGMTSLVLGGFVTWENLYLVCFIWWFGNVIGAIIITPLIILWFKYPRIKWTKFFVIEAILAFSTLFIAGWIIFSDLFPELGSKNYPLAFLILPSIVWIALRMSQRGAATAVVIISAIAIQGNLHGYGPYFRENPQESLLFLQAFVGVLAVVTHMLASVVANHRSTQIALEDQSLRDPLTNLPNRKAAEERVNMAIDIAKRNNSKLAVLFLDLDRFKNVNDHLGHDVGDLLLKEVACRLKNSVREEDTVARFGGDEFLIVLREVTSKDSATNIAQKILYSLEPSMHIEANGSSNQLNISGSIGITIYPEDGLSFQSLLKNADMAMYQAKEVGRRGYQLYNQEMKEGLSEKVLLEEGIYRGLKEGHFSLVFQPYLNLSTNKLQGVEALVRWNHPKLGPLYPQDFISIAEETGLIVPLGNWVLETACREIKKLKDKGVALQAAVNLSARQFADPNLVQTVAGILKNTGLEAKYLELEITESIAMQNLSQTQKKLRELRELGLSIAIDDFGMGYSSLGYLKLFPVQKLKIDSSFVQKMTTDKRDSALVQAIISLGHELGLTVCAEGIEKDLHRALLHAMGCDLGQGFWISRPLSSQDLMAWTKNNPIQQNVVV